MHVCVCSGIVYEQGGIHEAELEPQESHQETDDEGKGLSTEQQVQVALQNLSCARDIPVQLRPCDKQKNSWLLSLPR